MANSVTYKCVALTQDVERPYPLKGGPTGGGGMLPDRTIIQRALMVSIKSVDPVIGEGLLLVGDLTSESLLIAALRAVCVGQPGFAKSVKITIEEDLDDAGISGNVIDNSRAQGINVSGAAGGAARTADAPFAASTSSPSTAAAAAGRTMTGISSPGAAGAPGPSDGFSPVKRGPAADLIDTGSNDQP